MRFRAGGKWYNIKVEEHEDYYIFHTQYVAKDVREEIKKLQNRKDRTESIRFRSIFSFL